MKVFVARLSLSCDTADPAVLQTFDERWTQKLERAWSTIVVNYDDTKSEADNLTAFAAHLDGMVQTQFTVTTPFLVPDVAAYGQTFASLDPLFGGPRWKPTATGHIIVPAPVIVSTTTGGKIQWGVNPSGPDGFISISSQWVLLDVQ